MTNLFASTPAVPVAALAAQVYVRNLSTVVPDSEVQAWIPGLQAQVSQDFAPFYRDAQISFLDKNAPVPAGSYPMNLFDTSDQAGALGYHLADTGWPEGRAFLASDIAAGANPSITVSHETLEMLADPFVSLVVWIDSQMGGFFGGTSAVIAYEVADGPEADQYGYKKAGVPVSDFVLPWWFGGAVPSGFAGRYSFTGATKQAFGLLGGGKVAGLLPGGYIGIRQIKRAGQWGTVNARRTQFAEEMDRLIPEEQAHVLTMRQDGTLETMGMGEIPPGGRRWRRLRNMQRMAA